MSCCPLYTHYRESAGYLYQLRRAGPGVACACSRCHGRSATRAGRCCASLGNFIGGRMERGFERMSPAKTCVEEVNFVPAMKRWSQRWQPRLIPGRPVSAGCGRKLSKVCDEVPRCIDWTADGCGTQPALQQTVTIPGLQWPQHLCRPGGRLHRLGNAGRIRRIVRQGGIGSGCAISECLLIRRCTRTRVVSIVRPGGPVLRPSAASGAEG